MHVIHFCAYFKYNLKSAKPIIATARKNNNLIKVLNNTHLRRVTFGTIVFFLN